MDRKTVLKAASFLLVIGLIALLALLTHQEKPEQPCANPQADISAAVLAEQDADQDALVNRAIILRGPCEEE
ncbi:MAG: hypothetical protein HOC23_15350 [Halieaceae bacterium]|jgi:hypothetical protein|nr:hypothetical protein [Halieaceae bacterium]